MMLDKSMISFSTIGWTICSDGDLECTWTNALKDSLSLRVFRDAAASPSLSDIEPFRDHYRSMAVKGGGALVEAEFKILAGVQSVRSIVKFPQQPQGMRYIGSLAIPVQGGCFGIAVHCSELGVTGLRDALVWQRRGQHPDTNPDDPLANWFQDPYDANFRSAFLRNRSDDEEWDSSFPDHPLWRVRRSLSEIESTLRLEPAPDQRRRSRWTAWFSR